jgi:hypothetical protein
LALAALLSLAGGWLPRPWRRPAIVAAAAWIVAVGAARTEAMQAEWDRITAYPRQVALLRDLVRVAPGLRPNTLVLSIDAQRAFPATFGFRHAVDYLYSGQAAGLSWGALDTLYPARLDATGVSIEPWPVIRGPWSVAPTHHRFDEILVVRRDRTGHAFVQKTWPSQLPPLPPGARYDPEARILASPTALREREVLALRAAGSPSWARRAGGPQG